MSQIAPPTSRDLVPAALLGRVPCDHVLKSSCALCLSDLGRSQRPVGVESASIYDLD